MKLSSASKPTIDAGKNLNKLDETEKFDKFNLANACSATDCTGLIQISEPIDDEVLEAYNQVYNFGPPDMSR